jgi:hypothetical protein
MTHYLQPTPGDRRKDGDQPIDAPAVPPAAPDAMGASSAYLTSDAGRVTAPWANAWYMISQAKLLWIWWEIRGAVKRARFSCRRPSWGS